MIDRGRRVEPLGATYVDDKAAVSQSLAQQVSLKAMSLESSYTMQGGRFTSYRGQMGLIRGELLHSTPENPGSELCPSKRRRLGVTFHTSCYQVTPFTALHNIINERGETFEQAKASLTDPPSYAAILTFPEGGRVLSDRDKFEICPGNDNTGNGCIFWECLDVTRGTTISQASRFDTEAYSYEKVLDDFDLRPGYKIGIAVF